MTSDLAALGVHLAGDDVTRAIDAATASLRKNSRIAGDRHKRNALWKWMYRGV